jgi:hypothetical protein
MARITVEEAQGWVDRSKINLATLDLSLLNLLETEILTRIASAYDISTWISSTTTPDIIRVIISKTYAAWIYDRAYSENQTQGNDYAIILRSNAELLISGLIDGTIDIPGVPPIGSGSGPSFYPNDASSAQEPTAEDPSLGPAYFSMGKAF